MLLLAASACSLGAADEVGRSENHSTEQGDLYQSLDAYGLHCEGNQGTTIDVAALSGRYATEVLVGESFAEGACRLKLRCDIASYRYWPGGGILRASLEEFSLIGSTYTDGLVHSNGHALLAKHHGGVVPLECTAPQNGDERLLDSVERSGLTCMTPSQNSMLYIYEFGPGSQATLMWPEDGGRCNYELACLGSAGAFEVQLPDLQRQAGTGPASFRAEGVVLRRGSDDNDSERMVCETGRD